MIYATDMRHGFLRDAVYWCVKVSLDFPCVFTGFPLARANIVCRGFPRVEETRLFCKSLGDNTYLCCEKICSKSATLNFHTF